jgi:hypothetical protein
MATPCAPLDAPDPLPQVSSQLALKPVLQKLGAQAPFSPAADFSRMAAGPLFVSDVLHKVHILGVNSLRLHLNPSCLGGNIGLRDAQGSSLALWPVCLVLVSNGILGLRGRSA